MAASVPETPSLFASFGLNLVPAAIAIFNRIRKVILDHAEQSAPPAKRRKGLEEGAGQEGVDAPSSSEAILPLPFGVDGTHAIAEKLRVPAIVGDRCPVNVSYSIAVACCMQMAIKGAAAVDGTTLLIDMARAEEVVLDLDHLIDGETRVGAAAVRQLRYANLLPVQELEKMIPWILYSLQVKEVTLKEVSFVCFSLPVLDNNKKRRGKKLKKTKTKKQQPNPALPLLPSPLDTDQLFKHVRGWARLRLFELVKADAAMLSELKEDKKGKTRPRWPSYADVHFVVLLGLHHAILTTGTEPEDHFKKIVVRGARPGGGLEADGGVCSLPGPTKASFDQSVHDSHTIPVEFKAIKSAREFEAERVAWEDAKEARAT